MPYTMEGCLCARRRWGVRIRLLLTCGDCSFHAGPSDLHDSMAAETPPDEAGWLSKMKGLHPSSRQGSFFRGPSNRHRRQNSGGRSNVVSNIGSNVLTLYSDSSCIWHSLTHLMVCHSSCARAQYCSGRFLTGGGTVLRGATQHNLLSSRSHQQLRTLTQPTKTFLRMHHGRSFRRILHGHPRALQN